MRILQLIALAYALAAVSCAAELTLPVLAEAPLDASAGCVDGRVVIQNKSGEIWTDIKIQVNGEYEHAADGIPPYTTMRYLPSVFTRSDGTRLDLSRVACKRIDIHASTPSGRRHWNGGR